MRAHQDHKAVLAAEPVAVIPNGVYTLSDEYGHATFSVETEDEKSEWAAGKRVLWMLVGPDNWKAFAWVGEKPNGGGPFIYVFKKLADTTYAGWARILWRVFARGQRQFRSAKDDRVHTYTVQMSKACLICNQRLTTPESIARGIGPVCAQKIRRGMKSCEFCVKPAYGIVNDDNGENIVCRECYALAEDMAREDAGRR